MRPPPAMMSAAAGWGSASSMTCGQLSHRQLPATYRGPRASPLGPSHLGAHAAAVNKMTRQLRLALGETSDIYREVRSELK